MSVGQFKDGSCVPLPPGYRSLLTDEQRYLRTGRTAEFFFKQPTDHHFQSMRQYFRGLLWPGSLGSLLNRWMGVRTVTPIRRPTYEESPRNIERLRVRFPEVAQATTNLEYLHFLMLYKLQHERLSEAFRQSIPGAAFLMVAQSSGGPLPTVVQEAINGVCLWDMVERQKVMTMRGWEVSPRLLPQWKNAQKELVDKLRRFTGSDHIDCNPKNFIFDPDSGTLFYVDSEPTFIRTLRTDNVNRTFLFRLIARAETPEK